MKLPARSMLRIDSEFRILAECLCRYSAESLLRVLPRSR